MQSSYGGGCFAVAVCVTRGNALLYRLALSYGLVGRLPSEPSAPCGISWFGGWAPRFVGGFFTDGFRLTITTVPPPSDSGLFGFPPAFGRFFDLVCFGAEPITVGCVINCG